MEYGWQLAAAAAVVVAAVLVFRVNLMRYERVSGYAVEIALWRTALTVGSFVGLVWISWLLANLAFAPGVWRNLAWLALFSLLEETAFKGAVWLGSRLIEKRYHL